MSEYTSSEDFRPRNIKEDSVSFGTSVYSGDEKNVDVRKIEKEIGSNFAEEPDSEDISDDEKRD